MKRRRSNSCPEQMKEPPRASSQPRYQPERRPFEVKRKQSWPRTSRHKDQPPAKESLVIHTDNSYEDKVPRLSAGANCCSQSSRRSAYNPTCGHAEMRPTSSPYGSQRDQWATRRCQSSSGPRYTDDYRHYGGQQMPRNLNRSISEDSLNDMIQTYGPQQYGTGVERPLAIMPPPSPNQPMHISSPPVHQMQLLPYMGGGSARPAPNFSIISPLPPAVMWNLPFANGLPQQQLAMMPYAGGSAPPSPMMINRPFASSTQPLAMVPYAGGAAPSPPTANMSFGMGNVSQPLAMVPYAGGVAPSPPTMNRPFGMANVSQPLALMPYGGGSPVNPPPMNRSFGMATTTNPMAIVPFGGGTPGTPQSVNTPFASTTQPLALAPYAGGSPPTTSPMNRSFGMATTTNPMALLPYGGGSAVPPPSMNAPFGSTTQPFALAPYAGGSPPPLSPMNRSFGMATTTNPLALVPYAGGPSGPSPSINATFGGVSQPLAMVPYTSGSAAPPPTMARSFGATSQPLAMVPYSGAPTRTTISSNEEIPGATRRQSLPSSSASPRPLQRDTGLQFSATLDKETGLTVETKRFVEAVSKMKSPEDIEQACQYLRNKSGAPSGAASCCAGGATAAGGTGATCRAKTNLIDVLKVAMKGFENLVASLQSASGTGDALVLPDGVNDTNRELAQDLKNTQQRIDKLRKEMIDMMKELIGVLSKLVS